MIKIGPRAEQTSHDYELKKEPFNLFHSTCKFFTQTWHNKLFRLALAVFFIGAASSGSWIVYRLKLPQRFFSPTSLTITVINKNDHEPVKGVRITLAGLTSVTDENGVVAFTGVSIDDYKVSANADNYLPQESDVSIQKGANNSTITLEQLPQRINFIGSVSDFIDQRKIAGVMIDTPFGGSRTDEKGHFILSELPEGTSTQATFTKPGYASTNETIEMSLTQNLEFLLVPEGKAYFVSAGDGGKLAIFSSDYNGTNSKEILRPATEAEKISVFVSPDRKYLVFLTVPKQLKQPTNPIEAFGPSLYLLKLDDASLVLLSEHFEVESIAWSWNSQYIGWLSSTAPPSTPKNCYIYSISSGEKEQINSDKYPTNGYLFNNKGTGVAYNQYDVPQNKVLPTPSTITPLPATAPESELGHRLTYLDLLSHENYEVTFDQTWQYYFGFDDSTIIYKRIQQKDTTTKNQYIEYDLKTRLSKNITPRENLTVAKYLSPTGIKFVYADKRKGQTDLYASDIDGVNEKQLTDMGTIIDTPEWDPSGSYVLFKSFDQGKSTIHITGIWGETPQKISDIYLPDSFDN